MFRQTGSAVPLHQPESRGHFTSEIVSLRDRESLGAPFERRTPLPVQLNPFVVDRNPLVAKLARLVRFSSDEKGAIAALCRNSRRLQADQVLVHEGERSGQVVLILDGMAFRYKHLANGRRQILGYLIPGDLCDSHFVLRQHSDDGVALLSDARVAMISIGEVADTLARFPRIERAFLLATLLDGAILREWLMNVAQRSAYQRVAHFLCEISMRLEAAGLVDRDGSFSFPLTQEMLADTTGLTSVHVNRTLKRLRVERLIVLHKRRLTIVDCDELARIADFEKNYLSADC